MTEIIVKGKNLKEEEIKEIEAFSRILEIESPRIQLLVGEVSDVLPHLQDVLRNPFERFWAGLDFSDEGTLGSYIAQKEGVRNVLPTILVKGYQSGRVRHELCHLREDELGWIDVARNTVSNLKKQFRSSAYKMILNDLGENTGEFFVKNIAARYGFANDEINLVIDALESTLAMDGEKPTERLKSKLNYVTMLFPFYVSKAAFGDVAIEQSRWAHIESLSRKILSLYGEKAVTIVGEYQPLVDGIEIPPNVVNLSSAYSAILQAYRRFFSD